MFFQTNVNKSLKSSFSAPQKVFTARTLTALQSAANSPVVGHVRTCPAPGTAQAVHVLLPRRFVLVTVHLTSSHSQSAGTFLTRQ